MPSPRFGAQIARDRTASATPVNTSSRPRDGDWFQAMVVGDDALREATGQSVLVNGKLESVDSVIDAPLSSGQMVWVVYVSAGSGGYVVVGVL